MGPRLLATLSCSLFLLAAQGTPATFDEIAARASAARLANDIPQSIELYRQALQLNSAWKEGWWFLGTLLYDADEYAPAGDALKRFVDLEPKGSPGWGLLGLCEFETGDYPPALIHIQRSLTAGPGDQPQMHQVLLYHEALLLARGGEYDKALQKYVWFVQHAPPRPALLTAMGIAALREPLLPKDIPPERQDLFAAAGEVAFYAMAQDATEVERAFHGLLERFPSAPGVHYMRATYLLGTAPSHAIAEFRRELETNPSNAAARAMLAWVLLNRGDRSAALPYAERAAQDGPALVAAQYALGRALAETGDVGKGIAHLELAVKLDPTNLENHLALASAYSKAGRIQDARSERRRSVEMAGGAPAVAPR